MAFTSSLEAPASRPFRIRNAVLLSSLWFHCWRVDFAPDAAMGMIGVVMLAIMAGSRELGRRFRKVMLVALLMFLGVYLRDHAQLLLSDVIAAVNAAMIFWIARDLARRAH